MMSLEEQWEGDFICGVLVRGVMRNKYEQVQEGEFIDGVLVKGKITFQNGRVFVIE